MSSSLQTFVDHKVTVITTEGRQFVGTLQGYDQTTNMILSQAKEIVISPDQPTEFHDIGLYIIRGETVCLCGKVDETVDNQIDWSKVRGKTIGTTKH